MTLETTLIPLEDFEIRTTDDRRTIEGIAVPWGKRTDRVSIPEMFDRGAFADLVTSKAEIKLTDYNHSRDRLPVGYSSAIEDRDAGLWMRFKLNHTPEGKSAFDNTVEGVYRGLSIGFAARSERMIDGVRHVTAARLHHVSLVEEPAYREAVIMEVRAAADAERAALDAEMREARFLIDNAQSLDNRRHTSQNLLTAKLTR